MMLMNFLKKWFAKVRGREIIMIFLKIWQLFLEKSKKRLELLPNSLSLTSQQF